MNMKTYFLHVIFMLMVCNIFQTSTFSQPSLFIRGTVKWNTGIPAPSLEIRLVQNDNIIDRVYTNQTGGYGFFGIKGQPSQYTLKVFSGNNMLQEISLQHSSIGERVDITVQRPQ
jgi:hypothetical protein